MQGKVCIVTGGNSGIGKVAARELAKMGATVVLICRNREKGQAALTEIKAYSGNDKVDLLLADFASLDQVRRVAEEFRQKYDRLDVLVNNAGLYIDKRQVSQDGYEMTYAVNHLAHFLLTNLLLDMLKASAPSRVVNVSSEAHRFTAQVDFNDLDKTHRYSGMGVYGESKLMNLQFTYELARRLESTGVTVNALHPGAVATNFGAGSNSPFGLLFKIFRPFLRDAEKGAETSIYLASSPDVAGVTGKYFADKRQKEASKAAHHRATQTQLWQVSEQLTGISEPVAA